MEQFDNFVQSFNQFLFLYLYVSIKVRIELNTLLMSLFINDSCYRSRVANTEGKSLHFSFKAGTCSNIKNYQKYFLAPCG